MLNSISVIFIRTARSRASDSIKFAEAESILEHILEKHLKRKGLPEKQVETVKHESPEIICNHMESDPWGAHPFPELVPDLLAGSDGGPPDGRDERQDFSVAAYAYVEPF